MTKNDIDWAQVDWSQNTKQLSEDLGVSKATVVTKRKIFAPQTLRKMTKIDWSCIDWSKSSKEIANELNWDICNISQKRKKLAPNTVKNYSRVGKSLRKNTKAVEFVAPNGEILKIVSVKEFVSQHPHWFKEEDLLLKQITYKSAGKEYVKQYCNAENNLLAIKCGKLKSWAGWQLKDSADGRYLKAKDWAEIDWSKSNEAIAKELGRAYNTVAKRRYLLGKSGRALTRKPRSDKGKKIPERAIGAVNQPIATEAARLSPKAGKFETNIHAKRWRLTREDGAFWEFANLYHFVRNHPELFNPSDLVWKRQGGKRGTGGEYCNATAGLLNITSGKTKTWKGWRIKLVDKEK